MAIIHCDVPGILHGHAEAIKNYFKSNLPTAEGEELDASSELGKVKKFTKMINAMVMVYAGQCLSGIASLNMIFNIQAEAGWQTERACQLFDSLSRVQMIKKLNEDTPKKREGLKVMHDKNEAQNFKYQDQAEIQVSGAIVMHLFLVCMKLYKSELMQARV